MNCDQRFTWTPLNMDHTNGNTSQYVGQRAHYPPSISSPKDSPRIAASSNSVVFPGIHSYDNLYKPYEDNEEPVNLSNNPRSETKPYSHANPLPKPVYKPASTTSSTAAHPLQLGPYHNAIPQRVFNPTAIGSSSNDLNSPRRPDLFHRPPTPAHKRELEAVSQKTAYIPSLPVAGHVSHKPEHPLASQSMSVPYDPKRPPVFPPMLTKPRQRRPRMSHRGMRPSHPRPTMPTLTNPLGVSGGRRARHPAPTDSVGPAAKLPIQALRRPRLPVTPKRMPKPKPVANTYQPILPLPASTQTSNATKSTSSHLASSSPAIQAALNQPVIGGKRLPSKKYMESASMSPTSMHMGIPQRAPAMMQFLNQPPLQSAMAVHPSKPGKQVITERETHSPSHFQSVISTKPEDRYVMASQIAGYPLHNTLLQSTSQLADQFALVTSPRTALNPQHAGKDQSNADQSTSSIVSDEDKFAPVDLRRTNAETEFAKVAPKLDTPEEPRSLLAMRLFKKQEKQLLPQTSEAGANVSNGSKATPSPTPVVIDFNWISYLKSTGAQAAPFSAFKHLEASLVNGFQIGMKVETPLRGTDTDKYWLATVVAVYGGVLKLRFDGYGEKSHDFAMSCSSGQLHPIGWCSKNHKSLLPPADIRHTQKQWKNFLLNVLQGAKTVPTYLLNSHGCPWVADRIRQGMRLEVQHESLPTAVWVAKVIRNVGGRMKLRYEGSIDDATDFWLFYLDKRAHPCGWSVTAQDRYIYKPPDEIKESYEYDAWSNILQEVTGDCSVDRIPAEIFQPYPELTAHTLQVGQIMEAVHPSGLYVGPARVSMVINEHYFLLEQIVAGQGKGAVKCYHSQHPNLLPVGWCSKNGVSLGKPRASNNEVVGEFNWAAYIAQTSATPASHVNFCAHIPSHQFVVGQRLEAVNPSNESEICVATITRIVERLMWLDIHTSTGITTILADVMSLSLFPSGWCESNNYPLTAPQIVLAPAGTSPSNGHSSDLNDDSLPRIYINRTCFSGPFLSKSRIMELPDTIGPDHIRMVVKEMLSRLVNAGYKSSYILKMLQTSSPSHSHSTPQLIKTTCKGKSYEGAIEACTEVSELKSYCKQICRRLQCCPNLVSTEPVHGRCNEKCDTMNKTHYLYFGARKPGRPSSTNPDGSKRKKRKKRKKVFTPKRNLYIPNFEYTGAVSDNGSPSSNTDDEGMDSIVDLPGTSHSASPSFKHSPTPSRLPSTPSTRPSSAEDRRSDLPTDHPLYQLQLTSVKKDSSTPCTISHTNTETSPTTHESHQYQIVKEKKKRGRPSKGSSHEALYRTKSLPLADGRPPTVPPLKIRRLELSPALSGGAEETYVTNASHVGLSRAQSLMVTSASTPAPLTVSSVPSSVLPLHVDVKNSQPDLLLKPAIPHPLTKSAMSFSQPRLHVENEEKVVLTDNPLYWDVGRLSSFINQTDCASLTHKLSDHEVDGQAFMMLVLPTVQEELGLKLGPALKLCHHVQRLKLAFYETFHPEELSRGL